MWRPGTRRVATFASLVALAWLAVQAPAPAEAHAQLVSERPSDGARLEAAPSEVVLVFNEPVQLASDGLSVVDSSGASVDAGPEVVETVEVIQPLQPLQHGWYVARWGIVSEDGHIVRGASTFAVGEPAGAAPEIAGLDDTATRSLVGTTRALGDLGLIVGSGAVAAWWLLGARRRSVARLAAIGGMVAALGTVLWLAIQLLEGGTAWLGTTFALTTFLRLALLLAAGVLALIGPALGAIALLAATLTLALGGHATDSIPASVAEMAHLAAAVVWLGAAPAVLLILRDRGLDDAAALTVVRRFSRLAALAIVVVGAAGVALAVMLTDAFADGLDDPWALILIAKVLVVVVAVILGALGRGSLGRAPERRRFGWLFVVDAAILVVVLALSAGLTLFAPSGGHAHGAAAIPRCAALVGGTSVAVVLDPARVGVNEVMVSGPSLESREVTLELRHLLTSGAPLEVPLMPASHGWHGQASLPAAGEWQVSIVVREDAFTQTAGACVLVLEEA